MEDKVRYKKIFIIFSQEDGGFGTDREPSGYVKIEVMDSKGKLLAQVQNLREEINGLDYRLYIIKCDANQISCVCAGNIPIQKNKGELRWEFNPDNVAMTGIPIEGYNIAVVLAEYKGRKGRDVICPLAGYKDKKIAWRENAREIIYPAKSDRVELEEEILKEPERLKDNDLFSKYEVDIYSLAKEFPAAETPGNHVDDILQMDAKANTEDDGLQTISYNEELKDSRADDIVYESKMDLNEDTEEHSSGYEYSNGLPEDVVMTESDKLQDFEREDVSGDDETSGYDGTSGDEYASRDENAYWNMNTYGDVNASENVNTSEDMNTYKDVNTYKDTDSAYGTGCIYKSKGLCGMQTADANYSPCMFCYSQNANKEDKKAAESAGMSTIERLRDSMGNYFEDYDPFRSRRRDYEWWKISNPVLLNNIFYQCNIKTPLLFNPIVMMSHFKYRHLITGIYTNRARRKEYIVFGVPGVYGVDDRPFGDMCLWVQVEGNRPKYGAFGYWVAYVEPRNGKILNVN